MSYTVFVLRREELEQKVADSVEMSIQPAKNHSSSWKLINDKDPCAEECAPLAHKLSEAAR